KLEIDGHIVRAERESDEGYEEIKALMPVVLTCAERVAQPIKMKPGAQEAAKLKPIQVVRAGELSSAADAFGFAGSPTWVQEVLVRPTRRPECKSIEAADHSALPRRWSKVSIRPAR